MAAAVVGGASLSAFVNVVFDKLASPEVVNLIRGKKLDKKLLNKLETTLRVVSSVLDDAEKKQVRDPNVNHWLSSLRDAVYEADDLLDEVSTKAATQKQVSNFLSRYSFSSRKMASKLQDIVEKLESVLRLKDSLDLKEIAVENLSWRAPSTSLEDGSHIYGRDKDKEAIIKLLLDDGSDGEEVSVIPIVGMGGVGKTTLAQLVYNDDDLKQKFDFKAWVCVSEEFDILKLTKTMTEAVTGQPCKINDLNLLHLGLMDKLKDKKFLIVLDDVWIEDYVNWSLLKKPFQLGIRGSKILVTTRNEKVVSIVHTFQAYHLNQLSNEDCWSVLASHACLSAEYGENTATLESIGKEIVRKCNGLPLAAQSLGGMLRRKTDTRDWNNILNSDIWELSESECNIIPALRISYHYLPPYLKRCFVYCSLFPKNYKFEKNELILLWMAEDLLKSPKREKTLEEVGCEYFDYLVSRSFFQRSSRYAGGNCFVMHDLMHDLASSLGGEFYFRSEELRRETKIDIKTRHLSFSKFSDTILGNFEVFGSVKFLRTFLPIINFSVAPFSNEKIPSIIMSKLVYLRVLSFSDFQSLDALPDSIGELIHLRYLNLSRTSIKTLPDVLCNLYNLQTLKLSHCVKLTLLPSGMQNLVNLRHLDIQFTSIKEMPRGIGKLNHLRWYLGSFIVGKHKDNGIKQLGGLSNLQGPLSIKGLENITKSDEALEAKIMDKKHIDDLSLEWSECNNSTDIDIEIDILCKLQPHRDLKSLSIRGYKGTRFPDWVGNITYHNMICLSLDNCSNCCMLPSLGELPSLKKLYISKLNKVEIIHAGFDRKDHSSSVTSFPSLEYLHFYDMPCWEVWSSIDSDAFPLLKHLIIRSCPKLKGDLPNYLPALQTLQIEDCKLLVSSLPRAPALRTLVLRKIKKVEIHVFPPLVERIHVEGSPMVESIVEAITNNQPTCLQSLKLRDCSSAISFPVGRLPTLLKSLEIRGLKKLEFPTQHKHKLPETCDSPAIHESCESLISLPLNVSFPNLTDLLLANCENLESLLVPVSESPNSLSSFDIRNCPNLSTLRVGQCEKLKSLPDDMGILLPKLENLEIYNCPEIESSPKESMPPKLTKVEIRNCEKLVSGLAWPSMDMLTCLWVGGPCDGIKCFPKEGLLPPSLKSLYLHDFSSLETLDCKGLLHLTSLQQLHILRCQKLENMSGERLPASLILLRIDGCPLLEKLCRKKHRQIWPKISHIRGIDVDGTWI